jgi:hypothetical protein
MLFNVNLFSIMSESEGFGINTDIFETNVLNLAVVLGVLVYYGRIAFVILNFCLLNLSSMFNLLRVRRSFVSNYFLV